VYFVQRVVGPGELGGGERVAGKRSNAKEFGGGRGPETQWPGAPSHEGQRRRRQQKETTCIDLGGEKEREKIWPEKSDEIKRWPADLGSKKRVGAGKRIPLSKQGIGGY